MGVGQALIASVNVVPECLPLSVEYPAAPEAFESPAVAVGQHEQPLSPVRGSHLICSETAPLRIEPHFGQVSKDLSEPQANVPWDILEDDELRLALLDDSFDIRPEVPLVLCSLPFPSDRERLTRISGSDEIHLSTPLSASEGLEIVPDRSWIQPLLFHPRHEDGRRKGFPLDVANGPGVKGSMDTEVESSDP